MKRLLRKEGLLLSILMALLLVTAACTPQQTPETPEQPETPETPTEPEEPEVIDDTTPTQTVTVTESEWKIVLDKKEVKAGKVKFIISNNGPRLPHAFKLVNTATGKGVGDQASVNLDEVDTVTINLAPGTYEIYCPLSGHKEKGMKTTLKVN